MVSSLLLCGCSHPSIPAATDAAVVEPRATRSASSSSAPSRAPGPSRAEPAPVASASDGAGARSSYAQAMTRGRIATSARRWKDAASAFEDALNAVPHDARANAELGYVEIQTNPRRGIATLLRAEQSSNAASLTAQVEFNLGLAYERTGDGEEAALAFFRSNALSPSAAATAKLSGRTFTCDVAVKREPAAGHVYLGWLAALKGLLELDTQHPPPGGLYLPDPLDVGTDADARLRMCVPFGPDPAHPCTGPGPFVVQVGANDGRSVALHTLVLVAEGKLLAFDAVGGEANGGRCHDSDSVAVDSTSADGRYVLVSALRDPDDMVEVSTHSPNCHPSDRPCAAADLHYCSAFHPDADADAQCQTACFPGAWRSTLHLYDVRAQREVLTLTRTGVLPDFTSDPKIPKLAGTIERDTVKLDGCADAFRIAEAQGDASAAR